MRPRARILMLAPTDPAPTGNGLAMRLWAWLCGAAIDHDVDLVVISVYDSVAIGAPLPAGVRMHRVAPPLDSVGWAATVGRIAQLPLGHASVVLACRVVLAPLGVAVAEALRAPLVVDCDDDEAQLHSGLDDPDAATSATRLAATYLPAADLVTLAAEHEADEVRAALDLGDRVVHLPNCVEVPAVDAVPEPPGTGTLLMLGNLTYRPNVEGACWLVEQVLPLLPEHWTVHLVGRPAPAVLALAGPRVRVLGPVREVGAAYVGADVVAVPLQHGAGTRIKLLEASAWQRPVVSTAVGAAGLNFRHGVDLLLADRPEDFAVAVVQADEPMRRAGLIRSARALIEREHSTDVVHRQIDALLRRVCSQPRGRSS